MKRVNNCSFTYRISRCVKRGDLSRADLALWFGRPYTTIRSWVELERIPNPDTPPGREAHRLLVLLEQAIEHDVRFPIPVHLSQRYRKKYVQQLVTKHVGRQNYDDSVFATDTTG